MAEVDETFDTVKRKILNQTCERCQSWVDLRVSGIEDSRHVRSERPADKAGICTHLQPVKYYTAPYDSCSRWRDKQ